MIEESLKTYRQERRAFIEGLKHYYGIDFYQIDKIERQEWLQSYIKSKREFFENLLDHWEQFPPNLEGCFPSGYRIDRVKRKLIPKGGSVYGKRSKR
jgi:hypothetical protein